MSDSPTFDLHGPGFAADPYPTYAEMRQRCPVHRAVEPDWTNPASLTPIWYITRHDDARAVLLDTETFVKDMRLAFTEAEMAALPPIHGIWEVASETMINREGEDHARLRGLVNKVFTPRMVETLRDRVQAIADSLIDAVSSDGAMELVSQYAFLLPITVIAEMLGVPSEDHPSFRRWSQALVAPPQSEEELAEAMVSANAFMTYLTKLFAARREDPRDDLITGLLQAEERGDRLSERELLGMVMLLLIAGHETTVGLIANGIHALLRHPDQLALLRDDPSLIESAVEEILRHDSSVITTTARWAARDVELRGQKIQRGDRVVVALAAAHHDPEVFEEPTRFDIRRDRKRTMGFGIGPHVCLGAAVARLEARVAIGTLIRRLPGLRLDDSAGEPPWQARLAIRSVAKLPVVW